MHVRVEMIQAVFPVSRAAAAETELQLGIADIRAAADRADVPDPHRPQILRLPLGTEVEPDDEIEIVKRFGEDVTPRRYEVERYTNDGPSGCRAYLKARTIA